MQLHHTAAKECVRRERVEARCAAIEEERPQPTSGEEHGGRRARSAGADDDHIV